MSTGILRIKEGLKAHEVTMRYENGGRMQVFRVDGVEYRLPGSLHGEHVIAALQEMRAK